MQKSKDWRWLRASQRLAGRRASCSPHPPTTVPLQPQGTTISPRHGDTGKHGLKGSPLQNTPKRPTTKLQPQGYGSVLQEVYIGRAPALYFRFAKYSYLGTTTWGFHSRIWLPRRPTAKNKQLCNEKMTQLYCFSWPRT